MHVSSSGCRTLEVGTEPQSTLAKATFVMLDGISRRTLSGLVVVFLLTTVAMADNLVLVTTESGQQANDFVSWTQLGSNGTLLGSSFRDTLNKRCF